VIVDPVMLAAPALLYRDGLCTIWHAGVVLGPPGVLVVRLDFGWVRPSDWSLRSPVDAQPIQAYLETRGPEARRILGSNGYGGGIHELTFHATLPGSVHGKKGFPPLRREELLDASLHTDVYPLDQQFVIHLDQ
jgi:hypothetical protein